jgi:hypothetical protein
MVARAYQGVPPHVSTAPDLTATPR